MVVFEMLVVEVQRVQVTMLCVGAVTLNDVTPTAHSRPVLPQPHVMVMRRMTDVVITMMTREVRQNEKVRQDFEDSSTCSESERLLPPPPPPRSPP